MVGRGLKGLIRPLAAINITLKPFKTFIRPYPPLSVLIRPYPPLSATIRHYPPFPEIGIKNHKLTQ